VQDKGYMSNRGQILIPTVILIIVVTIIILGVIMFLSEMTRLYSTQGATLLRLYMLLRLVYMVLLWIMRIMVL